MLNTKSNLEMYKFINSLGITENYWKISKQDSTVIGCSFSQMAEGIDSFFLPTF